MTNSEKKKIREVQSVLQTIQNGTPKFFNITQYERHGLIVVKKKWGINAVGNKVERGHTFRLTDKAKRILKVLI